MSHLDIPTFNGTQSPPAIQSAGACDKADQTSGGDAGDETAFLAQTESATVRRAVKSQIPAALRSAAGRAVFWRADQFAGMAPSFSSVCYTSVARAGALSSLSVGVALSGGSVAMAAPADG
jgi:hypothetical protein